ncbi:KCTD1_15 [Mytilus edulis]|uniref:KCTD1_15 n=1 Tax=Mytilus edulis TaxID=6550 RepID=A0A8S3TRI6_MYTED|nr:KCTD1_15 [Mytilus edulis]
MEDIADDASTKQAQNRFGDASEDEVYHLLTNINSKNTAKSTKFAVKLLRDYCLAKELDVEFENLPVSELCTLLKGFYINLRRHNGELYTRSSFLVVRQSLNRFLRNPPVSKSFDIMADSTFNNANDAFKAMCKKMRQEGKGKIQHKPSIQKGDIVKLYNHPRVFNPNIPTGLLNKVFFELILYFCRRGQENLRDLKVSDFDILTDDSGKRYVSKVTSELTKNHQGDQTEEFEPEGGRMYETKTAMCPLASFVKYLEKRNPNCSALLQRPKDEFDEGGNSWFQNKPLGKNTLGDMMTSISKAASLSSLCRDTTNKQKREMSKFVSEFTTVTETQSENLTVEFDNSVTEDELVLSASQTDEIIDEIVQGEVELQPLSDITNIPNTNQQVKIDSKVAPNSTGSGFMFHDCNVTINMVQP